VQAIVNAIDMNGSVKSFNSGGMITLLLLQKAERKKLFYEGPIPGSPYILYFFNRGIVRTNALLTTAILRVIFGVWLFLIKRFRRH
jgi:hypothetical protein